MHAFPLAFSSIPLFLAFWLAHGVVATVIAFFWKRPAQSARLSFWRVISIWLSTWIFVTVIASLAVYVLVTLNASELALNTLGNLLIPIVAGIWFARNRFTQARITLNT